MPEEELWLIELSLPSCVTEPFMEGLEEFADSMSCFEDESEKIWKLMIYTQTKPDDGELTSSIKVLSYQQNIDAPSFAVSKVEIVDWVAESQKNFKSVDAGCFFVYPSWRSNEVPDDKLGIEIDPQQAFGTGEHETTKGCLLAIQNLSKNNFSKILDVGCGSGILSIATSKLWPEAEIIAVDNDPVCIETSKTNAELNNVAGHLKIAKSDGYNSKIVQNNAPYDLITSNILALPLIEFAPQVKSALVKGGYIILAGMMIGQVGNVISAYEEAGLTLISQENLGDWSIVTMRN